MQTVFFLEMFIDQYARMKNMLQLGKGKLQFWFCLLDMVR